MRVTEKEKKNFERNESLTFVNDIKFYQKYKFFISVIGYLKFRWICLYSHLLSITQNLF